MAGDESSRAARGNDRHGRAARHRARSALENWTNGLVFPPADDGPHVRHRWENPAKLDKSSGRT